MEALYSPKLLEEAKGKGDGDGINDSSRGMTQSWSSTKPVKDVDMLNKGETECTTSRDPIPRCLKRCG
jgi:hypothetical protein